MLVWRLSEELHRQRLHVDAVSPLKRAFADLMLTSMASFAQADRPFIRGLLTHAPVSPGANMGAFDCGS